MTKKITITPSSGCVFTDLRLRLDRAKILTDLHAQADALLPPQQHPRLNALIKEQPAYFYVDTRVKLPVGTTKAKLKRLADKIYLTREK